MNPDWDGTMAPVTPAEPSSPVDTSTTMEIPSPGEAPSGVSGVTSFYGDTAPSGTPAWAQEATMNPDYGADAPAMVPAGEAAVAAEEPAAAASEPVVWADPGEAPKGVPGVTSYYGDTAPKSPPAWAAEATMNPDYSAVAPAAAAEAPAEAASEPVVWADPGEAPKGVPGVTSYYGDTAPKSPPAWAAEATMNPDYNAAPAAAAAAAAPAAQEAVEACRDALNAEAKSGIVFASNKWDVLPASYKTLDKIAKVAKDCNESFVIEIGGHTDNVGSEAVNQKISEMRANAVLSYLTRAGVSSSKIKAVGYGQAKPVADNGSAQGRAKNRRIEFTVTAN
jgi:outer membrane protein OmpA-like peptidoglycan-associated protein